MGHQSSLNSTPFLLPRADILALRFSISRESALMIFFTSASSNSYTDLFPSLARTLMALIALTVCRSASRTNLSRFSPLFAGAIFNLETEKIAGGQSRDFLIIFLHIYCQEIATIILAF